LIAADERDREQHPGVPEVAVSRSSTQVTRQMATVASQAIRDSGIGGYPRTAHDGRAHARPVPGVPAHAVGRHRGGRRAVADGSLLAGPTSSAEPARELLAAAPDADELEVSTAEHSVFAARSDRHAVVLVCGRFALPALVRFDLRMVLADLAGARRDVA
jgi:hypothetical protein